MRTVFLVGWYGLGLEAGLTSCLEGWKRYLSLIESGIWSEFDRLPVVYSSFPYLKG
jgi:hypothetical protein